MSIWTPEQLEDVPCDFCGSRQGSREFQRRDAMRVVECARCGLAFLNPRPKECALRHLYGSDYFTGVSADAGRGGLRLETTIGAKAGDEGPDPRALAVLSEVFGGVRNREVLEIGCATGDLLARIARKGTKPKGIDLSEFAVGVARSRGLDVELTTIEHYAPSHSASADVVIGLEVIEHVPSPSRFLRDVATVVRPGGLLVLSTPNYACAKRFGRDWLGFRSSFEHLYFFSLDCLTRLAAAAGFELRYFETTTFLGGPAPRRGFLARYFRRMKTVRYFVKEVGYWSALSAIFATRYGDHLKAPLGHTLLTVFSKH